MSNLYNTAAETITIVTQGSLWGATDSVLYSRVFRHCKQPTMGRGCNLAVFAMTTLQNHIWTHIKGPIKNEIKLGYAIKFLIYILYIYIYICIYILA